MVNKRFRNGRKSPLMVSGIYKGRQVLLSETGNLMSAYETRLPVVEYLILQLPTHSLPLSVWLSSSPIKDLGAKTIPINRSALSSRS